MEGSVIEFRMVEFFLFGESSMLYKKGSLKNQQISTVNPLSSLFFFGTANVKSIVSVVFGSILCSMYLQQIYVPWIANKTDLGTIQ